MKIARRIVASSVAAIALSSAACGVASAATPQPAEQAAVVTKAQALPGTHYIEMDIYNNTNQPLTLASASHDYVGSNNGHWQQRPLTTLGADSSETVTAYTDSMSGFEVSLDYTTPAGKAVLLQAVNYFGKSDNAGSTQSLDPSISVATSLVTGGWPMDMSYSLNG
jgi:hypothetical protein